MIQIRKDSWHYKRYSDFTSSPPKDLCSYVGGVLISVLIGVLIWMFAISSLILFICLVWRCALDVLKDPAAATIGVLLIPVMVGFCWLTWYLTKTAHKKLFSETSLIGAYLKAKKEKYCPLVEVVDPKEGKRA